MAPNKRFLLLISSLFHLVLIGQNPIPVVQQGHTNGVLKAVFSPDGRQLASASTDGTVKVWDVYSGKLQRTLPFPDWLVETLAFSPDGRWLAGVADESRLLVWDWADDRGFGGNAIKSIDEIMRKLTFILLFGAFYLLGSPLA